MYGKSAPSHLEHSSAQLTNSMGLQKPRGLEIQRDRHRDWSVRNEFSYEFHLVIIDLSTNQKAEFQAGSQRGEFGLLELVLWNKATK